MSMLFLFIITMSIFFICPLISSSSSTNHITSLFLVLFIVKTLNDLSSSFILICSSSINYLSTFVWIHPELTSILSYSSFLSDVFIFMHILSSLSLLSLLYRIIYWFFGELLCTEICCTVSTPNFQQNPSLCCIFYLYCLNYLVYFYSSYSILTYSLL